MPIIWAKTAENCPCEFVTFTQAVFFYAKNSKGNLVQHNSAKQTYIPLVVRLECVLVLKCPKIRTLHYLQVR